MGKEIRYKSLDFGFKKPEIIVSPVTMTEPIPKLHPNDAKKTLLSILQKAELETEKRIKAMMWFQQDYNLNHYSVKILPHELNVIKKDNSVRIEIERLVEYHPPKRNGHRRNHAPSDIYKDIAEQVVQQDIQKNSPVQTPFGENYGLKKQLGLI